MVFLHKNADTVLVVAHADRGHFNWCIPLAERLKMHGLKVELWTNGMCKTWVPSGTMDHVECDSFGDGKRLNSFVAGYKAVVSEGDSDPEGRKAVIEGGQLMELCKRLGISFEEFPVLSTGGAAGREAFKSRVREPDVAFVVWETIWGSHAGAAAVEAGKPQLGICPTYMKPYRAAYQEVPILEFDGLERVRNKREDILSDVPHEAAFVIAKCLQGKATETCGRLRFGPFLPKTADASSQLDPGLKQWMDKPGRITVVSLGSQSALATISLSSERDLLKGCLAASPRVLFASATVPSDDPQLQKAVADGQLRACAWLPLWAVLGHSNIGCFVSHCGANSTHEALAQGKPIVPLPFFDDQYYVAQVVEDLMGYTARSDYTPLRKAALRSGAGSSAVAAAVELGLGVPAEMLAKIQEQVLEEDGAGTVARSIKAKIKAAPKLLKPQFGKVACIKPEAKGLNFLLKVVRVCEAATGICEVVAGDASGVVTLRLADEAQAELCQTGASIRVQNARAVLVKGFVRVVVDKWGVLKAAEPPLEFDVESRTDISSMEHKRA